jgi:hypothetical protein
VNGVFVEETAAQRDITSGFHVTPRVSGETVTLDVVSQRAIPTGGLGPGAAEVSKLSTTLTGRLGEWIELGGVDQSGSTDSRGILARSSGSASVAERVWLRVTETR